MNDELPDADVELVRRLADALRAEADAVAIPEDSWTHLVRRLDSDATAPGVGSAATDVGSSARGTDGGSAADSPASPRRSWRLPMIAAAAVVAIAVVAAVLVAHRSPSGVAGAPATCDGAGMARVPVDLSGGQQAGDAGGVAAPSSTGHSAAGGQPSSAATPGSTDPGTPTAAPESTGPGIATPVSTVAMGFGGSPPHAQLCLRATAAGSASYGGVASDGTPLGYLTLVRVGTLGYLVAAVGPDVEQVQVQTMPAAAGSRTPSSTGPDPDFSMSGHLWTIDGGHGTPWSLPEAATTVWTDIGGGWRGFALLLPAGAATAEVTALDGRGMASQLRSVDLSTGRSSDQSAPPATTTFQPGVGTSDRPPVGYSSATASESGEPTETPSGGPSVATPAACAPVRTSTLGISDVGFEQAGVEYALDGHGGLCFLDRSTRSWAHQPARSGSISAAGITGPGTVVDLSTGKPSTVRFVWGAVTDQVDAVHATATDGPTTAVLTELTAAGDRHTRVFLIRVPATGRVTLTATDGSGAVLDTLTLP